MRLALLVLGACLVRPVVAQDDQWITIGRTDKMTWHVKSGSVTITEMQGVPVVMVAGRITIHETSRITLYKWYISVSDCQRGMGQVVALDPAGEYKYRQDFMYGRSSAASGLAEYICALYEDSKAFEERRERVE